MSGGVIIAAASSGSGKTTLTLALLRHFRNAGRRVASAKAGPDFIDAAFHGAASGAPCLNLDPWAMRGETIAGLVARLESEAEIVLCEGVMGLFDGAGSAGAQGSTADLAALVGWPVVLAVDVAGQSGSAAALLRGFAGHRPDVPVAGVIFNRVGGPRHSAMLANSVHAALPGLAILGQVPRHAELALPARHLGLVQAGEHPDLERFLDRAAELVAQSVDWAALLALARPSRLAPAAPALLLPLGQRIAVAQDVAFAFAYAAQLAHWRAAGAELSLFSPLADEAPAADADAVFLPGGYPELHAGALAARQRFLRGLREAVARGAAIYGECGGYMVLGQGLVDASGARHAMAGLLPLETSFAERHRQLGYRELRLVAAGPLGEAGSRFRGHEFHYASVLQEGGGAPLFHATDADGAPLGALGRVSGRVMGSFLHLIDRA